MKLLKTTILKIPTGPDILALCWRGARVQDNRGQEGYGGGEREDGKWDFQGSKNQKKNFEKK